MGAMHRSLESDAFSGTPGHDFSGAGRMRSGKTKIIHNPCG
jgi:hypothetical protein